MTKTIGAVLADASQADADAHRDAEVLLCHLLDKRRSYLFAFPEHELPESALDQFNTLWQRRMNGEPIAYLTGIKYFWSIELEVNSHTLVPRPDTEVLVQAALDSFGPAPIRVLDLGTGTGAIALALASERPEWSITATDIDQDSIDLARRNATRNRITNVEFRRGSWFEPVDGEAFDLIVSNPPYIAEGDPWLSSHGVKHEPLRALVSGGEGLDDIRQIIGAASEYLTESGLLMLEHGHDQGAEVRCMLQDAGFGAVETVKDLAGLDRTSMGVAQ